MNKKNRKLSSAMTSLRLSKKSPTMGLMSKSLLPFIGLHIHFDLVPKYLIKDANNKVFIG